MSFAPINWQFTRTQPLFGLLYNRHSWRYRTTRKCAVLQWVLAILNTYWTSKTSRLSCLTVRTLYNTTYLLMTNRKWKLFDPIRTKMIPETCAAAACCCFSRPTGSYCAYDDDDDVYATKIGAPTEILCVLPKVAVALLLHVYLCINTKRTQRWLLLVFVNVFFFYFGDAPRKPEDFTRILSNRMFVLCPCVSAGSRCPWKVIWKK